MNQSFFLYTFLAFYSLLFSIWPSFIMLIHTFMRVMVGWFAEVCRRRGLKVNAGKSKVMVLNGKEGLKCKVHVDGICLEHVSEFKYWGVFWANLVQKEHNAIEREECCRSLVNIRDLQLEYAWVLHETLLMPVLIYGSEPILWREKEKSRVSPVQMDNLRGLLWY